MRHYLVTGGAGFIGSHIVHYLSAQPDCRITVVDNLLTGSTDNIDGIRERVRFIQEDITNLAALRAIVRDIDYIIHQAALPSVPRSIEDPEKSNWNNINGTLNVLLAARDGGVQRVIFASSSSVFGANPVLPKTEDLPTIPKSPYGLTKLTGEHYCRLFHDIYGLETVVLRYFNVFGPRQNPNSQYSAVIPIFIKGILQGKPVTIHGDGEQSRDFTYVENVVQANILACHAPDAAGKVFHVGCGQRLSINALFTLLCELTGRTVDAIHTPSRSGDVRHSHADITAAGKILSYRPQIDVKTGLQRTLDYYSSQMQ